MKQHNLNNLTPTQKKKIWYSLGGVILIGCIIAISFLLWDNLSNIDWDNLKSRIATSIVAYLSMIFLGFKVVWFFAMEYAKKKKRAEEISYIITNTEKEVKKMSKKTTNTQNLNNLNKTFKTQNFTFEITPKKITIEATGKFTSAEDYYKKIKAEMGNFHELLRKYLAGEIE